MNNKHEVVFCIVNAGSSEMVMDVAREVGVTGGTVIHARGTSTKDAAKMFGITIQPEKDIVMIVVETSIKDKLLHALYKNVGLKSECQGIAFSLPVEDVVGLSTHKAVAKDGATNPAGEKPKKDSTEVATKAEAKTETKTDSADAKSTAEVNHETEAK